MRGEQAWGKNILRDSEYSKIDKDLKLHNKETIPI